ncbi:MAG: phosphatidate cytidylyltransferase [Firmicutes bacterium]|nr:phosphatidate cytidylyltransferase [Bacillota bacterium]
MLQRLITGIVIVLVLVGFFALRFVDPLFLEAFFIAILFLCVWEVYNAFKEGERAVFPLVAVLLLALYILFKLEAYFIYYVLVFVVFALTCLVLITFWQRFTIDRVKTTLFVLIYPSLFLLALVLLNYSPYWLLLYVLVFGVSMATDSSAYVAGKTFGRIKPFSTKLCPSISPNKTYAGAIGGVLGGIICALLVWVVFYFAIGHGSVGYRDYYSGEYSAVFEVYHFIILGTLGAVITQVGDLIASKLKRIKEIKDFSNLLPGHGGFLDRFDGLMFNAMLIYLYYVIVL